MNSSLYAKGEVVILKSTGQECIILSVEFKEAIEITGRKGLHSIFCYQVGVVGPNGFDLWTESALRKKHKPSEFSFNSLMDNLKLPQESTS